MSSQERKGWIDILATGESNLGRAFRSYHCPRYMFEEEYDRVKIKEDILSSHRIKDAIEKHSRDTGCGTSAATQEASKIIDEISHAYTVKMIRVFSTILFKVFNSIFQQVFVNADGLEAFRETVKLSPVVLVPTHNSYFDFLIVSAICFWVDLPIPAIVAGQDFLHIKFVNHMLRMGGALFMRRSFASDSFYRNIFTEYIQRILASGNRPLEFFVEGTRSRSGKALQPKLGLLAMILESYFHGFVQDVAFIPVSVSFEKATEEFLYLYELLGIPKPKESLSGLLQSRSILSADFGTVSVCFGKPLSLREYCSSMVDTTQYISIPRCERHLRVFGRGEHEMEIAKYFGKKLVQVQQHNTTIYPRAVLASLVLAQPNYEFGFDELAYCIDSIGRLLHDLGCNTYGFEDVLINKDTMKNTIKYCDYVLHLSADEKVAYVSPAVDPRIADASLMKTTGDADFLSRSLGYIYLSAQRNKLIHGCILPSMLLHAVKRSTDIEQCRKHFHFILSLFQIEFVFDPDSTADEMFDTTLKALNDLSLVVTTEDKHVSKSEESGSKEKAYFLLSLTQPFFDAYAIVTVLLLSSTYEFPLSFKTISGVLQLRAANVIKLSGVTTYESLSLHTLSNIVASFCKTKLLTTVKNESFETLVSEVNLQLLVQLKASLVPLVSEQLHSFLISSKL